MSAAEWDDEIAKLKATSRRRNERDDDQAAFEIRAGLSAGITTSAAGACRAFRFLASPVAPNSWPHTAGARCRATVAIGTSLARASRARCRSRLRSTMGSRAFRSLTGGTPAKAAQLSLSVSASNTVRSRWPRCRRNFIIALLDPMPPHAARNRAQSLSGISFAGPKTRKLVDAVIRLGHPPQGAEVRRPSHVERGPRSRTFEAHHPIGSKARLAFALGSTPRSGE